ncbi:hypothetical protein HDU76_003433, partial [Blyttiomyces sp. JEL0837]
DSLVGANDRIKAVKESKEEGLKGLNSKLMDCEMKMKSLEDLSQIQEEELQARDVELKAVNELLEDEKKAGQELLVEVKNKLKGAEEVRESEKSDFAVKLMEMEKRMKEVEELKVLEKERVDEVRESERRAFEAKLMDMKKKVREAEELRIREKEEWEVKLKEADAKLKAVENQRETDKSTFSKMLAESQKNLKTVADLRINDRDTFEKDLELAKASSADAIADVNQKVETLEEQLKLKDHEIATLSKALGDANEAKAQLVLENAKLKADYETLRGTVTQLESKFNNKVKGIRDLESTQKQIQQLMAKNTESRPSVSTDVQGPLPVFPTTNTTTNTSAPFQAPASTAHQKRGPKYYKNYNNDHRFELPHVPQNDPAARDNSNNNNNTFSTTNNNTGNSNKNNSNDNSTERQNHQRRQRGMKSIIAHHLGKQFNPTSTTPAPM